MCKTRSFPETDWLYLWYLQMELQLRRAHRGPCPRIIHHDTVLQFSTDHIGSLESTLEGAGIVEIWIPSESV